MPFRSVQGLAALALLSACASTSDGAQPGRTPVSEQAGVRVGPARDCQAEAAALAGAVPLSAVRDAYSSCTADSQGGARGQ